MSFKGVGSEVVPAATARFSPCRRLPGSSAVALGERDCGRPVSHERHHRMPIVHVSPGKPPDWPRRQHWASHGLPDILAYVSGIVFAVASIARVKNTMYREPTNRFTMFLAYYTSVRHDSWGLAADRCSLAWAWLAHRAHLGICLLLSVPSP